MKTKIICTIGPACDSEKMIQQLIIAGMNVARVNCSHGGAEENEAKINLLKKVRKQMGVPLAIMLDTKGPDIRIGTFENGGVELAGGQAFTLTTKSCIGSKSRVFVNCKRLPKFVKPGQILLLNDGFIKMTVTKVAEPEIVCRVDTGGYLSNRKSLFVHGAKLDIPFLSNEDKTDLLMGVKTDVDYIAASFVSCAKDVIDMKKFIAKGGGDIPIIAKIESMEGVHNIDEILAVADGMMTARGDLGVEFPLEQIPTVQKYLTGKASGAGKFVITATEMLESMTEKPRPTRAETTDVANSVYDGTGAVMLSGETAVGKYPVQAVSYMKKITEEAEQNVRYDEKFFSNDVAIADQKHAFAHTITGASIAAKARAVVAFTESGGTAIRVAKYRPKCQIYAFARYEKVFHQLAMHNDITPVFMPDILTVNQMLNISNDYILKHKIAKKGEIVVVNASYQDSDTDLVLIHPLS